MDPNATLAEMLAYAKQIISMWDDCNADGTLTHEMAAECSFQALGMAERFAALDSWIVKGGFLPATWKRA